MTALQYFRLFAPAFASVDDVTVGQWLTVAESMVNVGCLDTERQNMAIAYYAAHLLSVTESASSGAAGPVKSEREGDLSRSFGAISGDDTWLGQTPYGLAYLNLSSACAGASILTRMQNG
jgi:hypothetical protein